MASFSDGRCEAYGVCPNDPLLFTCEVNEANILRLTLPGQASVSYVAGTDPDTVILPIAGVTVQSLDVTNTTSRNFTLTLSIENASLLAGNEIRCDDTISTATMDSCPLLGIHVCIYNCSYDSIFQTLTVLAKYYYPYEWTPYAEMVFIQK